MIQELIARDFTMKRNIDNLSVSQR